MKVYVLYQCDEHKSLQSMRCFGVFSSEEAAIDAALFNKLFNPEYVENLDDLDYPNWESHYSGVNISMYELDEFEEN